MKKTYFTISILTVVVSSCILPVAGFTQPQYEWAFGMGTIASEYSNSTFADDDGNMFISGEFYAELDFDPSEYNTYLSSEGGNDGFFCKYNAFGELQWARSIGGDGFDGIFSIAGDNAGNIYVTGYFQLSADLDPSLGASWVYAQGSYDIFIAKYDHNGDLIWGKGFGGNNYDWSTAIKPDNEGNVYVTGYFEGECDFDPNIATHFETAIGEYDAFLAKYDLNGDLLWVNVVGGTGLDYATSLDIDSDNNIYMTGAFENSVPFGGGEHLTAAGGYAGETDPFFAKYASDGSIYWARSIYGNPASEGGQQNYGSEIVVDESGNVIVTGVFWITSDFDPDTTEASLTTLGASDIYFAKYDNDGNYLWAKNIAGIVYENSTDIDVDANGDIYLTGIFAESTTADFDPDPPTFYLTSAGDKDIFIAKYSSFGELRWAFSAGGDNYDVSQSIAVDKNFNIYVTGFLWSEDADFWPDFGFATVPHFDGGAEDIWFAKYSQPGISDTIGEIENAIDGDKKFRLVISPNPVNEIINFQIPQFSGNAFIQLINAEGKCVEKFVTHEALIQINVKGYSEGIYTLSVTQESSNYYSRIMITN